MTHPSIHERNNPNKIAYQMAATSKAITYRELDELSSQGAHLFRSLGLKAGDHIALLMENRLAFMEVCWAAQRSGLYYTAILSPRIHVFTSRAAQRTWMAGSFREDALRAFARP